MDDDTDTETTTAEPTATPEESIDAAATALNEAYDGIDRQSDALGEDGESFDESGTRRSISTANDHLDAAESTDLSDEQQTVVEEMRDVAAFFTVLTDTLVQLDSGFNETDVAQSYVDNDRFEDGLDSLDDARAAFRDASDDLSDAESAFGELESGSFERIDGTSYAEVEDSLQTTRQLVDTMDPFLTGYREFVRGAQSFEEGSAALDAEQFSVAAGEFDTAVARFDDAESAFRDAEEEAPSEMRSEIIDLTCFAGALRDAAEHFAAGSRAYDDGDSQTANEEFQAGQEDLNRCESSSSAAIARPTL
jgi:hypothetical protein